MLHVIYLVFNEGYSASSGTSLTRADLSGEAIRLGRLLLELLPEPEVAGLLGLMLLHESRRGARTDAAGDLVLLDDELRPVSTWYGGELVVDRRRIKAGGAVQSDDGGMRHDGFLSAGAAPKPLSSADGAARRAAGTKAAIICSCTLVQ